MNCIRDNCRTPSVPFSSYCELHNQEELDKHPDIEREAEEFAREMEVDIDLNDEVFGADSYHVYH